RSYDQYRHRVEIARDNGQLARNPKGQAVEDALERGHLEEVYERLVLDDQAVADATLEGWLTEQASFREYLASCPDPLAVNEPAELPIPSRDGNPTADDLRSDATRTRSSSRCSPYCGRSTAPTSTPASSSAGSPPRGRAC